MPNIDHGSDGRLAGSNVDEVDFKGEGDTITVFGDRGADERVLDVEGSFGGFLSKDAVDGLRAGGAGRVKLRLLVGGQERSGVGGDECEELKAGQDGQHVAHGRGRMVEDVNYDDFVFGVQIC